uniref:Uncharacterized protein n=1 Tax=Nelumbo nucifera TaxID=4432 RepID=A0A822XW80_NELNU|nr:TPA_asm: hypothetical protein HUJ06_026054 [Nelumbo nucifera]
MEAWQEQQWKHGMRSHNERLEQQWNLAKNDGGSMGSNP